MHGVIAYSQGLCLRKRPERPGGGSGGGAGRGRARPLHHDEIEHAQTRRHLVCKLCRQRITRENSRIQINGAHKHAFFNPYGVVYEIGCFNAAMGLVRMATLSFEFTWFPGYAWQPVECRICRLHLGWLYKADDASSFFGLILDRLEEEGEGE